jgi:hypothetical protein
MFHHQRSTRNAPPPMSWAIGHGSGPRQLNIRTMQPPACDKTDEKMMFTYIVVARNSGGFPCLRRERVYVRMHRMDGWMAHRRVRVCVGPRMAGPPASMMNHEGRGGFSSFRA